MAIQNLGIKAYAKALSSFNDKEKAIQGASLAPSKGPAPTPFADALKESLATVNGLQQEKKTAITAFASGEQQNVHELMISLQKASLAMNMTTAVRNKTMEAYKELARMQF